MNWIELFRRFYVSSHFSHNSSRVIPESDVDTYIEGSLAAEATMIVIDTLELLVQVCAIVIYICATEAAYHLVLVPGFTRESLTIML